MKCKKCDHEDNFFILKKNNNTGLYCKVCQSWQKWLNKNEIWSHKMAGVKEYNSFEDVIEDQVGIEVSIKKDEATATATGIGLKITEDLFFIKDESGWKVKNYSKSRYLDINNKHLISILDTLLFDPGSQDKNIELIIVTLITVLEKGDQINESTGN